MASAFLPPLPIIGRPAILQSQCYRRPKPKTLPRKCAAVTQCAFKNLLVIDLQELLRQPVAQSVELSNFTERVHVDRSTSKDKTYVLYTSTSGYDATIQSIQDAQLVHPDALAPLNGTELYQQMHHVPDPYWTKIIRIGWNSKPVEWVFLQFFKDEIQLVDSSDEFVLNVWCKQPPSADFCERAGTKLSKMGISARVVLGNETNLVVVVPAAQSASSVVEFCQIMLGVDEKNTFVFGSDQLVADCVRGRGTIGLCGAGSEQRWDAFEGRVFVSSDVGAKALLDGVIHHAIF